MKLDAISTEARNQNTMQLDQMSTKEILTKINEEDEKIATLIKNAIPQIEIVVEKIIEAVQLGGRLIYLGAGTSGRIGIMDAVECVPTFGVDANKVIGLLAGGSNAFRKALEGAEDDFDLGIKELMAIDLNSKDIVIGISASGRTPYVLGGVNYAKMIGCRTACITNSANSILAKSVDAPIEIITGPEVITGSTRMKAGTAQKLVCNMLSTTSMIKLGKVYENLMIDVLPTNQKLRERSLKIICDAGNVSREDAIYYLSQYQSIKKALFALLTGINDHATIDFYLTKNQGHLRKALEEVKNEVHRD